MDDHEHDEKVLEFPTLSATQQPVHLFLMHTTINGLPEPWRKDLKKKIGKLPEAVQKAMLAEAEALISKAKREEFNAYLIVHDTIENAYSVYAAHMGILKGKTAHHHVHRVGMGDEEEAFVNTRLNAIRTELDPDWTGDREVLIKQDLKGLQEFNTVIASIGKEAIVRELFGLPQPKTTTPAQVAALEKKYGKDKIATLTKRINEKKNGN